MRRTDRGSPPASHPVHDHRLRRRSQGRRAWTVPTGWRRPAIAPALPAQSPPQAARLCYGNSRRLVRSSDPGP